MFVKCLLMFVKSLLKFGKRYHPYRNQLLKTKFSIESRKESAGNSIDARLVHPSKAPSPIDLREAGNSIDSRLVHPSKALYPIDLREAGNLIDARLVHSLKA